jgi:hypothetical protein
VLEDAVCHISQRFGIDFSHAYQSDVSKKIVSVLILQCFSVPAKSLCSQQGYTKISAGFWPVIVIVE